MAFPLMAPADEGGEIYSGFLTVHGQDHLVEIHMPKAIGEKASIYTSPALQRLLRTHKELIWKRLYQSDRDMVVFLSDLREIMERALEPNSAMYTDTFSVERHAILVTELEQIGFGSVKSMNDRMDEISFELEDESKRVHNLKVSIPSNYPLMPPKLVHVELPVSKPAWTSTAQSLPAILQDYMQILCQYQDFFECMDQVDHKLRVLDPENPSRRDTWRRIALGNHCSLHIDVDPAAPRDVPRVKFFGNAKKIMQLKESWLLGADTIWDARDSLYNNLQRLLPLPSASEQSDRSGQQDTVDMECGICYTYKLDHEAQDQQTPDVICPTDHCSRGFHPACLYEWLRSNPSTTRSFNVLFGKCPYCNEIITIKAVV